MVTVYAVLVRAAPEHGGDFGSRKGSFVAELGQRISGGRYCGSMFRLLITSSTTGPSSSRTFLK